MHFGFLKPQSNAQIHHLQLVLCQICSFYLSSSNKHWHRISDGVYPFGVHHNLIYSIEHHLRANYLHIKSLLRHALFLNYIQLKYWCKRGSLNRFEVHLDSLSCAGDESFPLVQLHRVKIELPWICFHNTWKSLLRYCMSIACKSSMIINNITNITCKEL